MRKVFLALATEDKDQRHQSLSASAKAPGGFLKIVSVHQFRCSDHMTADRYPAIRKAAKTAAAGLKPQACVRRLMGPVRGGGGSPGIPKLGRSTSSDTGPLLSLEPT